jgi:hypothetical protein
MKAEAQPGAVRAASFARLIAIWGPGLLVMQADTDAGDVVTTAQAGAQWGYRLMPLVIGFLVALAMKALPEPYRLRGWYLGLIIGVSALVSAVGVFGGLQALM